MIVARGKVPAVHLRLAGPARRDMEDLLAWSEQMFGPMARRRYEALLAGALQDIAENPARPGIQARPELGANIYSYHLSCSRRGAAARSGDMTRVRRPRHVLMLRMAEKGFVDILRVLHDATELSRHLPDSDPNTQ